MAVLLAIFPAMFFAGCGQKNVRNNAADSLAAYVEEAKNQAAKDQTGEGSLWVNNGRQSNLFRDFKARNVNDIVTIRVYETTQATTSADAKSGRSTEVDSGFDSMFGAERLVKELASPVSGKSDSSFQGEGSTTRATAVSTTLSARVTDVLPNGYLLVEGIREIRLNNEDQTIYLTGVVRPEDIGAGNVVSSAAIAQMEIRVQGRGTVSQPLKPGWLYKILTAVMPF